MSPRRSFVAVFACACTAAVLVACTLTQSLDYLQKGTSADATPEGSAAEAGMREPTVLVPNQTKPGHLAQDATSLYWIAGGMVMSVPKAGGPPKAIGAVSPAASALVADPDPAGAVFVVVGRSVLRLPKDGSAGGAVFAAAAAEPPFDTIAATESSLYVLQYDQALEIEGARILRMAKDGGGGVDIAPDAGPMTLNLDTKSVFWVSVTDKVAMVEQLQSAAPGTTTAVYPFAADDDVPALSSDIAIDDTSVYWTAIDTASGNAKIVSRRRDPAATVVAVYRGKTEDALASLTIDATHVYFLETKTASVLRVPKNGGDVEQLLTGLKAPSGMVVDANAIYLTVEATGSTGQVLSLKK